MTPYACTQNSLFHIDYGVPLLATRSTDYRTSSKKYHDFMPSLPQDFDCRIKAALKPELRETDIALRNEYKSAYNADYLGCHNMDNAVRGDRAMTCKHTDYLRTTGEKICRESHSHNGTNISEMKGSYVFHNGRLPADQPPLNCICEMPECYRALQPDVNPAESGFFKNLDIYLSGNRSEYPLYTQQQLAKAQEHIFTIYDEKTATPKAKLDGNKTMFDKRQFARQLPNRFLPKTAKRVPNCGMSSECRSQFVNPACLEFYPYRQENGIFCPESFTTTASWQDPSAAAMYCSENCHMGSRRPIRSAVDINPPSHAQKIVHSNLCCAKD